jgi:bZIP transcription factor
LGTKGARPERRQQEIAYGLRKSDGHAVLADSLVALKHYDNCREKSSHHYMCNRLKNRDWASGVDVASVLLSPVTNTPFVAFASFNRKAARESRRRKKVMIEELQRSVIFFSRANSTLKQQNDDLTRLLMQAEAQVSVIESGSGGIPPAVEEVKPAAAPAPVMAPIVPPPTSAAAAAMAGTLPPMQPGATMQAMANFQQAAAAAMQAAVQGMKGIPGVSMQTLAAPAPGGAANSQQAYNDTMTALAMQQAAAAAAATTQQPQVFAAPAPSPAESKNEVSV